jgi:hypothetical protein
VLLVVVMEPWWLSDVEDCQVRRGDDGSEPYLIAQGGAPSGLKGEGVFVGTVNHTLGFGLCCVLCVFCGECLIPRNVGTIE